jgi:uncharacterized membrane protein (DUF373 family)
MPHGHITTGTRDWIAKTFTFLEDFMYISLGLLLAVSALALLGFSAYQVVGSILDGSLPQYIVRLLDQILLVLLIAELLYTVQVSFREHTIVPAPFLLVGLIAAIRRVLLLTAEFGEAQGETGDTIVWFVIELAVLSVLIMVLVGSIIALARSGAASKAERA